MDNKISTYSPAFSIVSWIALVGGIVTYLLGLWNAEMQLNEKGSLLLGKIRLYEREIKDSLSPITRIVTVCAQRQDAQY
nr:YiaA/YiaB family inner membrane protein [Escherichia coli]